MRAIPTSTEKTGAGQPGTWMLQMNGGAACKLPLNEWHVVGMRVYNTTIPATARIDMLVDGIVVASPRCARRRLRIDITPSAAGAIGLATWSGGASFDDVTFNALPSTNGIQFRAYYAFGASRLAVRQWLGAAVGSNIANLAYLHGDQLGSVSVVTKASDGNQVGTPTYYMPFGDARGTPASGLPTDRRFTGEIRAA